MAGGLIGSLRVALGLDSAQFTTGLAKARGELGSFSSAAKIGFAAVGAAALAAGTALGVAVKHSLDHADALGKAAQKAGVSVQALSRLEYAARLSDVSMEGLTGSLTKLGKAMVDATTDKTGAASIAFKALGVDVRDTSGNIRDSNAVFLDIADRFGRMEDGATKSTLAMQLFGKAGAELIPLLNSGRDGLKQMADEADRVGFTLKTSTTDAAQAVNDSFTRLGLAFEGVSNRVTEAALPSLKNLTDTLSSSVFLDAAAAIGGGLVHAVALLAEAFKNAAEEARVLGGLLKNIPVLGLNTGINIGGLQIGPGETPKTGGAFTGGWGSDALPSAPAQVTVHGGASTSPPPFVPGDIAAIGDAAKAAQQSIDPFQARMQELSPVLDQLHNPMSTMKDDLTDLETMYKSGRITAEAYGQAVQRTYANVAASALDMASGITGALASMFKDNKAFAVANAVVQTLSGVANAIGSGPPPWNLINAGIVAATGATNVANILSTSETSTSVPGNSAASAASGSGSTATPRQAVNISLQGASLFSTEMVEQLLNQMADAMGDGAGSRLINVVRA